MTNYRQSSFRRILVTRILLLFVPVLLIGEIVALNKERSSILGTARQNLTESAISKGERIGDAIAKWYEASVSSAHLEQTLIVAAVQQARVLRDILFQKSAAALAEPGSAVWREVVDATVLLAGVIGGLGGAQCRTVAAHAVHNGLTHLPIHSSIHGEKVAYGILVQLRLEEMLQGNGLAGTARQQLLKFYAEIGLPQKLGDLGLGEIRLGELRQAAEIAVAPNSDIHRLPFKVVPEQLMAAMVSTTAPLLEGNRSELSLNPAVVNEGLLRPRQNQWRIYSEVAAINEPLRREY